MKIYIEPAIEIRKERRRDGKPAPAFYSDEPSNKEEYPFEPITLAEIAQNNNKDYILVGESGIGKTSFLYWIGKQIASGTVEAGLIPLYIHLKDIADIKTINDFIPIRNTQYHLEDYDLGESRLLFLLDGLDQVSDYGNIVRRLKNKDIFGKENKIILTTRQVGYEWVKDIDHEHLRLLPFDDEKIKKYIGEDYKNQQFKAILDENKELLSIPILLKMVGTLLSKGKLSQIKHRADLYQKFIKYLFETWEKKQKGNDSAPIKAIGIQKDLACLSYHAMVNNQRGSFLIETGMECLNEYRLIEVTSWSVTHNLIEKDGEKVIAYTHQSFQEYLAAYWLWEQTETKQEKQILDMLNNFALWQEVIRFFFNLLGNTTPLHNKIKKSLTVLRDESHNQPTLFLACGDALGLMDEPYIDVADPPMVLFKPEEGKQVITFKRGTDDGDNDGKHIHQVTLSPYQLGKYPVTNKEFGEFIKQGGYENENYWFDEESQFKFDGREFLRNLKDEEKTPCYWLYERFGKVRPLAPVVGISWYEAMAYCCWWTETYGKKKEPKEIMRLPTEAEWEFAACGVEGRKYPWGKTEPNPKLVNYNYTLNQTSAVGSYPKGATPKGVLDMAGNVRERCYDWYDEDEPSPGENPIGPNKGEFRVLLCGISWNDYFREPSRNIGDSKLRWINYGMRVARTVIL